MVAHKVELIKCLHDKLLVTTHLPQLLEKYELTKFSCFKAIVYPRLVKMFYANLGLANDKVSCYIMYKHLITDVESLTKEFEMEASFLKLIATSFPNYKKEMTIDMFFPYQTLKDSKGKTDK